MKNTRFLKLAMLVLVCALSVCAFAGVMASAEDAAPAAEIESANVAYNDMVQLAFTVTSANLPEGAALGIMTWEADVAEFTVETAAYSTFDANVKDGVTYYKTAGIPAPEMDTPIYVAAVYKADGVVTVAETPFKYSALQYAGTRLTEANVTAKQAKLYSNLINYGIKSDAVFENAENYAFVKAVNGTIGSAGAEIGGWTDKTVLLRAEAKNAAGKYFIKWVDENGETVSAERLAFVTVTEAGITEYTAVFGEKADSAYANTTNFENLFAGEVTLATPDLSAAPTQDAYNTTYYGKCWTGSITLAGMTSTYAIAPLTEKIDGVNTLVTDADGEYMVGVKDNYYVTETPDGDKEVYIEKATTPRGFTNNFAKGTAGTHQAIEFDLTYEDIARNSIANSFAIKIKDSAGTEISFRTNLELNGGTRMAFCDQKATNEANKNRSYFANSAYIGEGSTLTVKAVIDVENAAMVIYANGNLMGSLPLSGWGSYKDTLVLDEALTITAFSISAESGSGNSISFDNVTYLAK